MRVVTHPYLWGWHSPLAFRVSPLHSLIPGWPEYIGRSHFSRLAGTSQRGLGSEVLQDFLRLSAAYLKRSPHRSRGDNVHPDSLRRHLLGETLC